MVSQAHFLHPSSRMPWWLLTNLLSGMSPAAVALPTIALRSAQEEVPDRIANTIRDAWKAPDTLSILLVIGGDVVSKALAQLVGPVIVPVAFSFGWVAYSFNTLMAVFGNGYLMPPPDYNVKLFNVASGISRKNLSWVLGRFLRDIERPLENNIGLSVSIFLVVSGAPASLDWCFYSGIFVILLQLAVAAVPCGLYGDWSTLLITGMGTLFALITGALPQWRLEKYSGRRKRKKVVALTSGNGSRNVAVIIDPGRGIDLEDLAAAQSPMLRYGRSEADGILFGLRTSLRVTQASCILLAFAWIVLLITVTGFNSHSWFLICVGGLGMLQNVIVAGAQRAPAANMLHLQKVEEIKRRRVMHALMDTEAAYPGVGKVLLPEFFAVERLRPREEKWWKDGNTRYEYDEERARKDGNTIIVDDDKADPHIVAEAHAAYTAIVGKGSSG